MGEAVTELAKWLAAEKRIGVKGARKVKAMRPNDLVCGRVHTRMHHPSPKIRWCRNACSHAKCYKRRFQWHFTYDSEFRIDFTRDVVASYYYDGKINTLTEDGPADDVVTSVDDFVVRHDDQ